MSTAPDAEARTVRTVTATEWGSCAMSWHYRLETPEPMTVAEAEAWALASIQNSDVDPYDSSVGDVEDSGDVQDLRVE